MIPGNSRNDSSPHDGQNTVASGDTVNVPEVRNTMDGEPKPDRNVAVIGGTDDDRGTVDGEPAVGGRPYVMDLLDAYLNEYAEHLVSGKAVDTQHSSRFRRVPRPRPPTVPAPKVAETLAGVPRPDRNGPGTRERASDPVKVRFFMVRMLYRWLVTERWRQRDRKETRNNSRGNEPTVKYMPVKPSEQKRLRRFSPDGDVPIVQNIR